MLISAAISRWIETDGGSILIHNIPVEIDEYSYLPGRIYRPIEASSLDRKSAILIDNALSSNLNLTSPLAIDLAQRGFVVLALGNKVISLSEDNSSLSQYDRIRSGRQLLASQPFVDIGKMGLLAIGMQAPFNLHASENWTTASILISGNPVNGQASDESATSYQATRKFSIPGSELYNALKFLCGNLHPNEDVSASWVVILREILLAVNFFLGNWLICDRINHLVDSKFPTNLKAESTANHKVNWRVFSGTLALLLISYGFIWLMTQIFMIDFRFFHLSIRPLSDGDWIRALFWLIPCFAAFLAFSHVVKNFGAKKGLLFILIPALLLTTGMVLYEPVSENTSIPSASALPDSVLVVLLNLWGYRALWQGLPFILVFLFLGTQIKDSHKTGFINGYKHLFYSTIFAWIMASSGF